MTAIHLPAWDERIDARNLDLLEFEGSCLYLAALLYQRLRLPQDLDLMDAIGWHPDHGHDDLSQLTAWALQHAAQGPITFRLLQGRLQDAIVRADAAWAPRRAELDAEDPVAGLVAD